MRRIGFGGISLAAGMMDLSGLVLMIAGRPIAGLFITSPTVVSLTALGLAGRFHIQTGKAAAYHRTLPPVRAAFPEHGSLL